MQLKHPFIRSLLIIGVGTTAFCAAYALSQITFAPRGLHIAGSDTGDASAPLRLIIPAINIDAAVEHVGITTQGDMDVPKGPSDVAWFKLGPSPGEEGSAVIAGHEGWKDSIPAAFDNLYKLQKGDKVYVTDESGTSRVFIVRKLETYDGSQNAPNIFSSSDGKAHLNLITCEGTWDKATQSYSDRLVVFTDQS